MFSPKTAKIFTLLSPSGVFFINWKNGKSKVERLRNRIKGRFIFSREVTGTVTPRQLFSILTDIKKNSTRKASKYWRGMATVRTEQELQRRYLEVPRRHLTPRKLHQFTSGNQQAEVKQGTQSCDKEEQILPPDTTLSQR